MGGGGTGSTPLLNAASPPTDPPSLAAPTAPGARPGRASIRPRDGCLLWQRRQGGKERRRRSVIVSRDTLLRKQTDSGADGGSRKGHRPARRIRKAGRHRAKQAGVLSQARGGGGGCGHAVPTHPPTSESLLQCFLLHGRLVLDLLTAAGGAAGVARGRRGVRPAGSTTAQRRGGSCRGCHRCSGGGSSHRRLRLLCGAGGGSRRR